MYTRKDFMDKAIEVGLAKHPAMANLIKANDARTLQSLEAMATMLEMYSSQLEVAQSEPFEKTRDSTVMADAAMRGLVPKSQPSTVNIAIHNDSESSFSVEAGRAIMDPTGRMFKIESPTVVPAGGQLIAQAVQVYSKEVIHAVSGSRPFYEIALELADDDSTLCGLDVRDSSGAYEYRERYTNTMAGEKIYHVEVDERRQVYVRFGQDGVVGTQPIDGAEITIISHYSMGAVDFTAGTLMVFDVMKDPSEAKVEMRLDEVKFKGENPPSIITLRDLARYPSVYNHNAVFLGEFDFLVRRNFPSLKFLSVWNEGKEEMVRGMSQDNINALFVACLDEGETVMPSADKDALEITELTATQKKIKEKIHAADDSYRVRFFSPVRAPLSVSIKATIPTSYDTDLTKQQISSVIIDNFGEKSHQARHGQAAPLYQQVYKILRDNVPALAVAGSDLEVDIDAASEDIRPELWRYVSESSLIVGVFTGSRGHSQWGGGM